MKEYLKLLLKRDYKEPNMKIIIESLLTQFNNEQINYMLSNGLKISNNIILYYYNGQGFRCINENEYIMGKNPVCSIIEKTLNDKMKNM
jgi:hypothetical protein